MGGCAGQLRRSGPELDRRGDRRVYGYNDTLTNALVRGSRTVWVGKVGFGLDLPSQYRDGKLIEEIFLTVEVM